MAGKRPDLFEGNSLKTTVLVVDQHRHNGIRVISDGVKWTAERGVPWTFLQQYKAAYGASIRKYKSTRDLSVEAKRMYEWVRTATLPADGALTIDRPQESGVVSRTYDLGGRTANITLVGYGKKVGAYPFERIVEIIEKSIGACLQYWGWFATDLVFELHDSDTTFGLAFRSGRYAQLGYRRLSLTRTLFKAYDAQSIYRIVVHELCHHYREETFPPTNDDGHDQHFCDALRLVDPVVTDRQTCQFFHGEQEPAIVEKVARAKTAGKPPVWSPDAGTVVFSKLKSGQMRWTWAPRDGFSWGRTSELINDESLLALLQHFAPAQWTDVRVEREGAIRPGGANLRELAEFFVTGFRKIMPKTAAYMTATP